MSKTWCPIPWIFQAVRNNGDLRVCCQANIAKSKGTLKKEGGGVFNARFDNLKEARNSPTLKKIRLEMLEGKNPETCIRCEREDATGVVSRRNYETKIWKEHFDINKARELTNPDGSIDPEKLPLTYYDLRFGNLCNLKCRMCGPTDSNAWYSDQVKVWGPEFSDSHGRVRLVKKGNHGYQTENQDYDWVCSENFWRQIKSNAPHIRHIHTVGGEPLLIDKHYELLEAVIKYGNPGDVTIEYNTNLTILPKKAVKIWKEFKNVKIGASIDGFGKINDYIRYPSRWEKIEGHLDLLDKATGNFNLWIATTVQVYNILHLPDLIKWRLEKKFKRVNNAKIRPLLTTHLLHNPDFLNIKLLPQSYKKLVEDKFNSFYPWLRDWSYKNNLPEYKTEHLDKKARELLGGYVKYMNSEDWSHLIPKFFQYTNKLDEIRGEKISDVVPELYFHTKKHLTQYPCSNEPQ